eukprot:1184764-Prymnesium_polylepis.1
MHAAGQHVASETDGRDCSAKPCVVRSNLAPASWAAGAERREYPPPQVGASPTRVGWPRQTERYYGHGVTASSELRRYRRHEITDMVI